MKTREEKKKPRYSVLQNTVYLLKKWWRWGRGEMLTAFLRIPALVLIPFLGILLPKAVIDCITRGEPLWLLTAVILGFTAALVALHCIERAVEARMWPLAMSNRMHHLIEYFDKSISCDYENIENPAVQRLQQGCWEFIQQSSSGSEQVVNTIVGLIASVLGLLLYGGVLSTLHPLVMVILVLLSVLVFLAARAQHRFDYSMQEQRADLHHKLLYLYQKTNDFSAGKDMRIYRLGRWFAALTERLIAANHRLCKRSAHRAFAVDGLQEGLGFLRDLLAYGYLIALVVGGRITVGEFTLFFGAVAGFSTWLSSITQNLQELTRISTECCKYRDFIEYPDHPALGRGRSPGLTVPCEIVFDHVGFCYPGADTPALRDTNFRIMPGEKIALVGVNGAGKTTCVKLLCGFYRPTEGRILVDGVDIAEFDHHEYFRLFSTVFQDVNFMPFTVAMNVAFCEEDKIDYNRVRECLRLAGMWERVEALPDGVESLMDKTVHEDAVDFSGGELQKLLLARALYRDAPVIVLDEPTAALDPIAENELYQKYDELTQGRTSIFISHRLSSTRFCDRILFLEDGQVTEEGTHDELLTLDGGYAHMFEIQSHYYKKYLREGNQ